MKTVALFFFLAGTAAVMADDNLLRNGDFSNGLADWEGDCHTLDSTATDLLSSSPASTSGVIVKLRDSDWTKVTQDFDGKIGEYLLTITYSVSSDLKFSDTASDYMNVPGQLGFSRLKSFNGDPGRWVVIINDLGAMHYTYWQITPKNASGVQSINLRVQLDSDDTVKKGFYLVFPPGQGSITLQGISLVPAAAGN